MTLLDHHVIKIHPDSIHLLLPETFSLKNKNINLTVTVDKKSGHRRSLLDSSYEGHNCLQGIYRRSVQELLRYFSLDRAALASSEAAAGMAKDDSTFELTTFGENVDNQNLTKDINTRSRFPLPFCNSILFRHKKFPVIYCSDILK